MPNNMMMRSMILVLALYAAGHHECAYAHGDDEAEAHDERAVISHAALKAMDIDVQEAAPALVRETVSVNGRVTLNQNSMAQVKARFPGIIRSVSREPGEAVQEGDILATVESNDSLQVYPVKSPVSGTIISRNANIGELAADMPLFVVADLSRLWAELFVFSKDGEHIRVGQKVRILCLDDPVSTESTITLVLPTAEASSQTLVARAVIDNASGHWRSGMNIRADVVLEERQVPLAVRTEAIQRDEGKAVVFVQEDGQGNTSVFRPRTVEIGLSDGEWSQITGGLKAGERYVARNSFIVKADIAKAGAAHEH